MFYLANRIQCTDLRKQNQFFSVQFRNTTSDIVDRLKESIGIA